MDEAAIVALRLAEARKAVQRGWLLTPLRGKLPRLRRWQKRGPVGSMIVEQWARDGNVGLRTGAVSGVVVLDDDTPDGSAAKAANLPPTVTVVTGSGKRHYYFGLPDFPVRNSVKTKLPGIDVRGDCGQVTFVGSVHPDTKQPYLWAPGLSPDEITLAPLPEHVCEKLRPKAKKPSKDKECGRNETAVDRGGRWGARRLQAYVTAAVKNASAVVRGALEGTRNDTLNKAAYGLGRLVGAGLLDESTVTAALREAAAGCGLPAEEAEATVRSGLAAGVREPRDPQTEEPTGQNGRQGKTGEVTIIPGFHHRAVVEIEGHLAAIDPPLLYQRGTCLVKPILIPSHERGRAASSHRPLIWNVDVANLSFEINRNVVLWKKGQKGPYRVDCPKKVAQTILSIPGEWPFPNLVGVITTPTLRPDGSLLHDVGYDPKTGLYLAASNCSFPEIPAQPTLGDAHRALDKLLVPLKDFVWLEPADLAVAISFILTPLIRPALRTAPLGAIRAAKMSSGKTLIAEVTSMIATGSPAATMPQGRDEEEDRKRLLAILMEGNPVAVIDNIERPFGSAALCSILTQQVYRDRILGRTETAVVPTTNTTWFATGNNLQFDGDITTRVIVCDLDPKVERPEERKFDVDLYEYVPAHRGELVAAGLTILRAYHVAGRPSQGLSVFGRFEEWSNWVRSAIVWVGLPDPCSTRHRLEESDSVRQGLARLLRCLAERFGTTKFASSAVIGAIDGRTPDLRDAVSTALDGEMDRASQRLGLYLARHARRFEGGRRLVRAGEENGAALWRIEGA